MFDRLRNFFGNVYVEEKSGLITIGGLKTVDLLADIRKIWGNDRVVSIMFIQIKQYTISFYSFFGVDVLYILQQVWEFKKRVSNKYRTRKAIEGLKEHTWLRRMDQQYQSILDMDGLDRLKFNLREHQTDFLHQYDQKTQKMGLDGFLLAAAPGAGKTLTGLALSVTLDVEVSILLAPKSILDDVWTNDVIRQFDGNASYWVSTGDKPITSGCRYYITHYESLSKLLAIVPWLKTKRTLVVLDESHNFNDSNSIRSKMLVSFCKSIHCHHVVFSSGTPIKAIGFECITLLQCIDPLFTPDVEVLFRRIFGVSSKRAVDILRHRIDLIGHKIPREVFMDVAPPIIKQVRVKLPGNNGKKYTVANVRIAIKKYMEEQSKYYEQNMKRFASVYNESVYAYKQTIKTKKDLDDFHKYLEYIREIQKGFDPKRHKDMAKYCNEFEKKKIAPALNSNQRKAFKDATSVIKYVKLKILGLALSNVLGKMRSECHCEMIEYSGLNDIVMNADKKTLCFSDYVDVIKTAEEYFIKNGLRPTMVYGGNKRPVGEVVDEFRKDPTINPILSTLKSMSAGITLTNCSICIFLNPVFRQYLWEQGSARIYRIGTDCQTYIYEMLLDTGNDLNISVSAYEIMEWSRQQVELIMGKNISEKEMSGIIERLDMNPKTPLDKILNIFRDIF